MKISYANLLRGSAWLIGTFGISLALRVVSSVILARLLAPEAFGIMVLVLSLMTGAELLSNVGFGQSVISNKNSDQPDFLNTVWSLRLVRGLLLSIASVLLALPLANFYERPILAIILPIVGLYFAVDSLGSLTIFVLQKQLKTPRLAIFDLRADLISTPIVLLFAYANPTIWALVLASLLPPIIRSISSYLVMPELRHKFHISKEYTKQILSFGRWLFLSSVMFFLAANFDRLYLGKNLSFALLGIYGIARNFPEILNSLAYRLIFTLIFPLTATHTNIARGELKSQFRFVRASFLLLSACGISAFAAVSDLLIKLLYDHRYHDAGWMVCILTIGLWFSILSTFSEATLLGFGKSSYGAFANCLKFVWLLISLPFCMLNYGLPGVVFAVALSDLCRYVPLLVGQRREQFSFLRQDVALTLFMLVMFGFLEWLRFVFGFGTSFADSPFSALF
jgi:O-antigen/teichoic acid export membrane protein